MVHTMREGAEMVITHRDVGRLVIMSGKTRHGKNRIDQHGQQWKIREVATFVGLPAMHLESMDETFSIRTRDADKTDEWTTKKVKDTRWVHLRDDENFVLEELV